MEHVDIQAGEIHQPHNWQWANQAARLAQSGLDESLTGKFGLQLNDGTLWRLASIGPTVWAQVAATAAWDDVTDKPSEFPPSAHTHSVAEIDGLDAALDGKQDALGYTPADEGDLAAHVADDGNPHAVTATQVGLGNVENKSSATIRSEITSGNVTTALGYTPVDNALVGANSGVAQLDSGGKVPAAQLPSYVDDVLEYANTGAFPGTGETSKIYVAIDTGRIYRWSGSVYVEISPSPGSTDSVTEGTTNLYFTPARVLATLLAGLSTATNAVITTADSVLTALGKLQKQISDKMGANPSASVGLSAVNGNATTFMRSDAAPALDQAISPVWTGSHRWNQSIAIGNTPLTSSGTSVYVYNSGSAGTVADNVAFRLESVNRNANAQLRSAAAGTSGYQFLDSTTGSVTAQLRYSHATSAVEFTNGVFTAISINASGNVSFPTGSVAPGTDNTQSFGSGSLRWSVIYAGTGTINTSDGREKTAVTTMTVNEIAAAKALAAEIGTFKFLDAITQKGDDARLHVGMTVQRAIEIMGAHGLDPLRYGFICYDEWEAREVVHEAVMDGEEEVEPAWVEFFPAGNRYGFRADELALFLARGFEARLAALESQL